ncbi:MAG: hypothetical protein JXB14_05000 [Candidatus Altiarchaeota archaeon]|nr:hypothetical protein [Candidatus Altiarchaeota archaeon]
MTEYYDLHIAADEKDLKRTVEISKRLGWSGLAIIKKTHDLSDFLKFKERLSGLGAGIKILAGVELYPTNLNSIQQEIRKFRRDADVIFVSGDDSITRAASDCWELDCISSPINIQQKDFMKQRNSGIDYAIAKSCAEKGIAIEIRFSDVLRYYGKLGSELMARIKQNIDICNDTRAPLLLTSGAKDPFELRSPLELLGFGRFLGMSKYSLSEAPRNILERTNGRKDPNVILKGLRVQDWGDIKLKEKRLYGWY